MHRLATVGALLMGLAAIPATTSAEFFSFENGMEGWTVDGTDLAIGDGEIEWHIERSTARAADGVVSLEYFLRNHNDAGKIWIERPFQLRPNTSYRVEVAYRLASRISGQVGTFRVIAGVSTRNPEVRGDLTFQDTTYNGGTPGYVWLPKKYTLRGTTDPFGRLWVAIGIWGTFEVAHTYYVDALTLSFIPYAVTPVPTFIPTPPRPTATPVPTRTPGVGITR